MDLGSTYRQSPIKSNLQLRAEIIQAVRNFFLDWNYLEVETPIRIPAPIPEAHIDAVVSGDQFLQTSPEICMKQLLSAGFPRIFQICKCFRQNERGDRHLPELTMLEWYRAGGNYLDLMVECEELISRVARHLGTEDRLIYQNRAIDLTTPWLRLTVTEAFQIFGTISMKKALETDNFDTVMAMDIEPNLGYPNPVFLHDYPAQQGSLARLKPQDPAVVERFELYIAGIELCNGFSELTDATEQRERFEEEQRLRQALNKPVYPWPEKFLAALADMPAAGGNALGIDRLVMLFADAANIDDVVAFTPEDL
jgi:lysyl-tRNA synthetase class 2